MNPFPMTEYTPQQTEWRQLRRGANFVGVILLAIPAMQLLLALGMRMLAQGGILAKIYSDNTTYLLFNMVTYLLYLAVPALLAALCFRHRQNPFPTRRVSIGNYAVALFGGMALAVASNYATNFIMMLLSNIGVEQPQFPETQSGTPVSLVLNLISTAVFPALAEEMVFRGYVLGALRRGGNKMAIVLSAALFGLIHGNVLQIPFAFFLGLALGWLVVQTNSIWPAVILHFGNNAMSVLLDYVEIAVGNSTVATTLTFGVLCAAGIVTFLAALLSTRKRGEDLFRPIGNGVSTLSVLRRVTGVLTAPAMIMGVGVWCVMLVVSL